jgi:hydroxyquinol 1,2-dioxygenase
MTGDAEKAYFTEADSVEVVTGCTASGGEERLSQIMEVVIRHLHAAVKEIEPTQEEWFQAIQFLTETGHMSDDWRQEFILLSDVLGVSMLVDAINNRKPSGATETTVLGPFHVGNVPVMKNGANICLDGKGEPLVVHGKVLGVEGAPMATMRSRPTYSYPTIPISIRMLFSG